MCKFRRVILLSMASILVTTNLIGAIPPIVGFHSLNNSSEGSYKTEESLLDKIASKLGLSSDFNEILNYSKDKINDSSDSVKSYLLEHDLITSDLIIHKNDLFNNKTFKQFDYNDSNAVVSRSDFLVTLTKAVYGVQESRPLVYKSSASRVINNKRTDLMLSRDYIPNGYEEYLKEIEDDEKLDFTNGDYVIYITPNVYEMYFKVLIDKGIISLEEFSNISFIEDINNYGKVDGGVKKLPVWSNELGYYLVGYKNGNSNINVYGDNPLGQAFTYDDGDVLSSDSKWLLNESLLTIDALKYIESILRLTEKDMTETEANLINYKYGVNYLSNIPSEDVNTIKFLVAKGVLNFEDDDDFKNFYKPLTMDFFLKLIYRVDNPNARMDFSKIQLTDNDNYWLNRGFSQGSLKLIESENYPYIETEIVSSQEVSDSGFIKSRPVRIAAGEKEYKVERIFYNSIEYYYKGDKISSNTKTGGDISKVEAIKSGGNVLGVKVTFTIKAASEQAAIAILDAYTYTKNSSGVDLGTIPTVNKVTEGKNSVTYVSQDALINLKGSPIKVIEDKYLMNVETGARALLLEDNKIAIIGNEIIRTEDNIVFGLNGEVHYNFDIIAKLLSQAMISELEPNSVYLTKGVPPSDTVYTLKSTNGSTIGTTYGHSFKVRDEGNSSKTTTKLFYNVTHTNSFSNFLIKNVSEDLGTKKDTYMVIEFKYVVSKNMSEMFSDFDIGNYLNNALTMKQTMDWIYTKPTAATLSKWWDENVSFNNSLINYMMGTKNVNYMKSGYLVPSISFLGEDKDAVSIESLNSFFKDTVKVSSTLLSSYNSTFVDTFFTFNGSNKSIGALDSLKLSRVLNTRTPRDSVDSANYKDYGDYVITKSGQVYKSIESDTTLEYDALKKTISRKVRHYNSPSYRIGALYQINGTDGKSYEYICTKIYDYNLNNLVSTEPVYVKYKDGKLYMKDSDTTFANYVMDLNKTFSSKIVSVHGDIGNSGNPGSAYTNGAGTYYMDGKFYDRKKRGGDLVEINPNTKEGKKMLENKENIQAFPVIAFSPLEFTADSSNVIDKEYNFPFLDMGTVVNVGISAQIIDSVVQNNSDFVTTAGVPQNASVIIGDIQFIKKGDSLVSPILNIPAISSKFSDTDLGNGTDSNENVKAMVVETLGNLGVTLINNGVVDNGNLLSSYLTYSAIGSGNGESNFNRALLRENNKFVVKDGSTTLSYSKENSLFSSFSISIKLDNNIKFRPIGSDNNLYSLVTTVSKNADGYLGNMKYFRESLSYSDLELFRGNLNKSLFSESKNSEQLIQEFRDLFSLKTERDVIELVKYWIRIICLILTFSNIFIAYIKRTVLDVIIKDIRYPSASDRNGIDIYKILTLGFQDVDTEISAFKAIGLSFMFFAIMIFVSL